MSDIDYIRGLLKKFEENINNKEGVEYLRSALADMACIFEEADNEKDIIIKNTIRKYCNVVMDAAKKIRTKGTPSFDELNRIEDIMQSFKENGFADEPDFKDLHGKIFVEYLEAFCRGNGRKLEDATKVEIYERITKRVD